MLSLTGALKLAISCVNSLGFTQLDVHHHFWHKLNTDDVSIHPSTAEE